MRKVLLVGWDAADWKVMKPLMAAGKLPTVQSLIERGTMGNLTTLHPILSPMLWTSIATGQRPFRHGVLGFLEPAPGGGVRPVSGLSRRVKAVWNILAQSGKKSIVLGWWPSHPAEPLPGGVMVSNHFQAARAPIEQTWPLLPGTIHPERLTETLADLRVHPQEIVAEQLLPFVPGLAEVDREKDRSPAAIARVLAECASIQAAATHLCESEPWDLLAVYFDGIDHLCHGFMRFHPPRQDWIPEREFELYKGVVETAYRFHDMMLGALLRSPAIDAETTVLLVSDHGFHPDHLRHRHVPDEPAGPAAEHRDHGVIVACGPGIKRDELIHGASLIDVTPTILTLFGLPVGEDMDGAPLIDLFETPPEARAIPSWEDAPGDAGMHAPHARLQAQDTREALEQLVALGYVERPSEDGDAAVKVCARESDYNLALSYIDAGRHGDAIPHLERLVAEWPREHRFGVRLALCHEAMQRPADQRRVVEAMLEERRREIEEALAALATLDAEIRRRHAERPGTAPVAPGAPEASGIELATAVLSPEEQRHHARVRRLATRSPYAMHYLMGSVCHAEGKPEEALAHLAEAEKADPAAVGLHILIGNVYLRMRRWGDAEARFRQALARDPESEQAHLGLARSFLSRRMYAQAAASALSAIELRYHFPLAHFHLGVALERTGRAPRAVQAFEVAVAQNPSFLEAHERLETIHRRRIPDPVKAARHAAAAAEIRKREPAPMPTIDPDPESAAPGSVPVPVPEKPAALTPPSAAPIVIVSGLPRSGTSMMMQMLAAGGLPALTDGIRAPDEDNPRGYLELEAAKALKSDASFLSGAAGKAVKIVAQLLPSLPGGYRYRIVFMERDLDEVLRSQAAMLARQKKAGAKLAPERLKAVFAAQVAEVKRGLAARPETEVLYVGHREAIGDPAGVARRVAAFLGDGLDVAAMAATVDAQLHRNKKQG